MPAIEIPDSLFRRLQKLAVPLVDTTASVLEKLADHFEACQRAGADEQLLDRIFGKNAGRTVTEPETKSKGTIPEFDPDAPPDLRHTRILSARFGGRTADGWNELVHVAHTEALVCLGSVDSLRGATKSNFVVGRASQEQMKKGYRYVPQIDISIQNVDAEHAWSNVLRLAKHLGVPVAVDFEWMPKADAARPGEKGCLSWN